MKLRIVWLLVTLVIYSAGCNSTDNAADATAKSADKVMVSELHGMNHTIRNFQDLLKREPKAEAYAEYADFLERRLNVITSDFSDELDANPAAKKFAEAIEKSLPELRNSDANKRNLAQKNLNDANENASRDLKLN